MHACIMDDQLACLLHAFRFPGAVVGFTLYVLTSPGARLGAAVVPVIGLRPAVMSDFRVIT